MHRLLVGRQKREAVMHAIRKSTVAGALGLVLALTTGVGGAGALQDRDQLAPPRAAQAHVAAAPVLSHRLMPVCAWRHC
jgi:hypothetical protein